MKFLSFIMVLVMLMCSCAPQNTEITAKDTSGKDSNELKEEKLPVLTVLFGDVGKADFMLLSCDGEYMVIDTGVKKSYDYIEKTLEKFGVEKLKYVVGTHPDKDHIGSMAKLIKNFDIEQLYISPRNNNSNEYEKMMKNAQEKNVPVITSKVADVLTLGGAVLTTYAPNDAVLMLGDDNEASVVQMLEYGDFRMLLMGDGQLVCESVLLNSGFDLKADVIKIAHHGSNKSSTEGFLKAVGAKYAVISASNDGEEELPSPAVVGKIENLGMEVYRTDRDGGIILKTDGVNIEFERGFTP